MDDGNKPGDILSMQLPGIEKIDKDKILATSQEWKDNYLNYRWIIHSWKR